MGHLLNASFDVDLGGLLDKDIDNHLLTEKHEYVEDFYRAY